MPTAVGRAPHPCYLAHHPPLPQTTIKYGVVEAATLLDDLTNWRHVYLAGRMHKPTTALVQPSQVGGDARRLPDRGTV